MARKTSLSLENLTALGAGKLAQIILDEAQGSAPFRKKVNAALAGAKGPEAVAALIDRRLAALEKARAQVAWEKEKDFAADLAATADTILKELAQADAGSALERLLRFIDTHAKVFERIDDSSGRIQDVYWRAAKAAPDLTQKLPESERVGLAKRLANAIPRENFRREMAVRADKRIPRFARKRAAGIGCAGAINPPEGVPGVSAEPHATRRNYEPGRRTTEERRSGQGTDVTVVSSDSGRPHQRAAIAPGCGDFRDGRCL